MGVARRWGQHDQDVRPRRSRPLFLTRPPTSSSRSREAPTPRPSSTTTSRSSSPMLSSPRPPSTGRCRTSSRPRCLSRSCRRARTTCASSTSATRASTPASSSTASRSPTPRPQPLARGSSRAVSPREPRRSPGSSRPPLSSTPPRLPGSPGLRPGLPCASTPRPTTVTSPSPRRPFSRPASSSPSRPARLRSRANQADYLLIAPQAFLAAAQPLLDRRASQGLTTFAASLEEITSSFGAGQPSGEALRDFLSFAYHHWTRPSPRYVLLLGDSNYDPRHFSASSQPSPLPYLLQKTSYMWTASDPALVALNGDDPLPDLADRTASRYHSRAGPDPRRQDPRLGGPGTEPRRQGRSRRRQPRPRRRGLRGRRARHRELVPHGKGHDADLLQPDRQPVARSRRDPRRHELRPLRHLLRGSRGGGLWADENILNSGDANVPPRPAATAPHAHHELPQRLLHRGLLRVPRRGLPQGPGQGHRSPPSHPAG